MARRRRTTPDLLPMASPVGNFDFSEDEFGVPQFIAPRPKQPQYRGGGDEVELSPEEETSLLEGTLGGLQWLGETLDKPGAAMRGLLAGRPGQLLNLIPFSDTLGITNPQDRTSGRDLLEQAGLLDANTPGLDWGDVAGFGAEVLTDPLLLLGAKLMPLTGNGLKNAAALAKEGAEAATTFEKAAPYIRKVLADTADASKLGTNSAQVLKRTPNVLAKEIAEGDRALFGFRVPFTEAPQFTTNFLMSPELAAGMVDKAFYGRYSPLMFGRGLFSHTGAGGKYTPEAQRVADMAFMKRQQVESAVTNVNEVFYRESDALEAEYRAIAQHFQKAGDTAGFNTFTRAMATAKAGVPKAASILEELKSHLGQPLDATLPGMPRAADALGQRFYDFIKVLKDSEDSLFGIYKKYGGNASDLQDEVVGHFGRRANAAVGRLGLLEGKGALDIGMDGTIRRVDMLRELPEETINQLLQSPAVTGHVLEGAAEVVAHPSGFARGQVVRALDRSNYGRVVSVADNAAEVLFRNPETGAEKAVKLPLSMLRQTDGRLGVAPPLRRALEKDEHIALLRAELDKMGVPYNQQAGVRRLREQYIQNVVKSVYDDLLQKGTIDADTHARMMGDWGLMEAKTAKQRVIDELYKANRITKDEYAKISDDVSKGASRAELFGEYTARLPGEIQETGMFNGKLVEDWHSYMMGLTRKIGNVMSAQSVLAKAFAGGMKAADDIPLDEAWRKAGFGKEGLETFFSEHPNLLQGAFEEGAESFEGLLKNVKVSNETAGALKAIKELSNPKVESRVLRLFDKLQGYYKYGWTRPFPGFYTRNLAGGLYNSIADQQVGMGKILAGYGRVGKYLAQKARGTASAAEGRFIEEGIHNGILSGRGAMAEITGKTVPHEAPTGILGGTFDFLGRPLQSAKSPLQTFKSSTDRAYEYVESLNRLGYYDALRRAGKSPAEAQYLVKRSQFDYSDLSPFERNFMRRAVPFFGWLRNNLPFTLATIGNNLGGKAAQTARAYRTLGAAGATDQVYTPKFLREGLAIPLAGGTPDAQSFFRQAGLPLEDLNKLVFGASGLPALMRTGEKLAANLSPAALAPAELWAGKQAWSGRDIKDLESATSEIGKALGGEGTPIPWLDRLAHYSPLSTATGHLLNAIDERKSVPQKLGNFLTGAKTATYDVEKWKLIDLQDAMKRELQDNPLVRTIEQPVVPKKYKTAADAARTQEDIRKLRRVGAKLKKMMEEQEAKRNA